MRLLNSIRKNIFIYFGILGVILISLFAELKMLGILAFIISLFLYVMILVIAQRIKKNIYINYNTGKQILIILFIIYAFVHSSILSSQSHITHTLRASMCSSLLTIFILFFICYFSSYLSDAFSKKNLKIVLKNNKYIFMVLVFSAVPRIIQIDTIPIFDAEAYYYALASGCLKFDFSITNFLQNFMISRHPTFGYCMLLSIGEFLFPGKIYGVHIINLILTLYAIFFVFKLLNSWLPKLSEKKLAYITLIISVSPMFLGTFSYIHMDYGIALFLIYVVYMYSNKNYILGLFFSIILLSTKEVGIVVYAGFVFGFFIIKLQKEKGHLGRRFINVLCQKEFLIMLLPFLLVLGWLFLIISGHIEFWNPIEFNSGSSSISFERNAEKNSINTFGFNNNFIFYRLKQTFIFNGYWVVTLLLIIVSLSLIYTKIKMKVKLFTDLNDYEYISGTVFSGIFLFAFTCVYMTYQLMRYNILIEIIFVWLTLFLLSITYIRKKIKKLFFSVLFVFFILQAHISIDPITNSMTIPINTKKVELNMIAENTNWPGDPMVYNFHYNYFNHIIDSSLKEISYHGKHNIFVADEEINLYPEGMWGTYDWDIQSQKRVFSSFSDSDHVPIKTIHGTKLNNIDLNSLEKQAILIITPAYDVNESAAIKDLEKYYKITGKERINDFVWGEAYYYTLELKKDKLI